MSKIKIYKNRYGKEPLVVGTVKMGEMRRTLGSNYKGMVWCPYIPMMTNTDIGSYKKPLWLRLHGNFHRWFYDVCHREYKSKYLMECLQDFYKNYGDEYILELRQYKYTDKKVNEKYFSKITTNDAKD